MNSSISLKELKLRALIENQEAARRALGHGHPKKTLWTLSWPAMASMGLQAIFLLVDSIMIAQKDPYQASATSFTITLAVFFPNALGLWIALGANGLISRCIGERDFNKAADAVAAAVQLCFIFGFLYPIIILFELDQLMRLLGLTENLMSYGRIYCQIMVGGTFSFCCSFALTNILQAQAYAKISGFCQILGTLANLIVDPIMIFKFNKGVVGSATATIVGNLVTSLCALFFLISHKKSAPITIEIKRLFKFHACIWELLALGIGGFFSNAANGVSVAIFDHLLKRSSPEIDYVDAVAATIGCGFLLIYFFFSLSVGVNIGFIPAASYSVGAGLTKRFAKLSYYATLWESLIMLFGGAVITAFAKWWPFVFYAGNDETNKYFRKVFTKCLYVIAPSRVTVGCTIVVFAMFQACHMPAMTAFVSALRQLICLIPLCYIFAYTTKGPIDLLIAYPVSDLASVLITLLVFWIYRHKLHLTKSSQKGPLYETEVEVSEVSDENSAVEVL